MNVTETLEEIVHRIWREHTSRSMAAIHKAVESDTGAARSQFTYHVAADVAGAYD